MKLSKQTNNLYSTEINKCIWVHYCHKDSNGVQTNIKTHSLIAQENATSVGRAICELFDDEKRS